MCLDLLTLDSLCSAGWRLVTAFFEDPHSCFVSRNTKHSRPLVVSGGLTLPVVVNRWQVGTQGHLCGPAGQVAPASPRQPCAVTAHGRPRACSERSGYAARDFTRSSGTWSLKDLSSPLLPYSALREESEEYTLRHAVRGDL